MYNCETVSILKDKCYLIIENFNFESDKNNDKYIVVMECDIQSPGPMVQLSALPSRGHPYVGTVEIYHQATHDCVKYMHVMNGVE